MCRVRPRNPPRNAVHGPEKDMMTSGPTDGLYTVQRTAAKASVPEDCRNNVVAVAEQEIPIDV